VRRGNCWSAAILAILGAGCVSARAEYIPVVPAPRQLQLHGAAQVQTFLVTPPGRPHLDIGMLHVATCGQTLEQTMVLLRTTAGQRGCDAVVITNLNVFEHGRGTCTSGSIIDGSCEVYTDAPP
jgi:hypothetical protein